MSLVSPLEKDGFYFNGDLYVEVGVLNRHKRVSIPELRAILRPDLKRSKALQQSQTKDPVGHWYEAQLIHYGLQPSKTKAVAKVRLLEALNTNQLAVPERIVRLEEGLRKEFNAAERKAKAQYKAGLANGSTAVASPSNTTASKKRPRPDAFAVNVNVNINGYSGYPGGAVAAAGEVGNVDGPAMAKKAKRTPPTTTIGAEVSRKKSAPKKGSSTTDAGASLLASKQTTTMSRVDSGERGLKGSQTSATRVGSYDKKTATKKTATEEGPSAKKTSPVKKSLSAKKDAHVKEELSAKQEPNIKKERAIKKETPLKRESGIKKERVTKRETPLKGEPSIKNESSIKREGPVKREPGIKKEKPLRRQMGIRTGSGIKKESPSEKESSIKRERNMKKEVGAKRESPVKRERGIKKEPKIKKEPSLKRETAVSRKAAVKREPKIKGEPSIKQEAPVYNPPYPRTEQAIKSDADLGPITGHYVITNPQWCHGLPTLTLYSDPMKLHLWGQFDFGSFSGIVFLPHPPSVPSPVLLPCQWRGREEEDGVGEMCGGSITFLGGGSIHGSMGRHGAHEFRTFEAVWVEDRPDWEVVERLREDWAVFEIGSDEERGWGYGSEEEEEDVMVGSEDGDRERSGSEDDEDGDGVFRMGRRGDSEDEIDYEPHAGWEVGGNGGVYEGGEDEDDIKSEYGSHARW